MNRVLVARVKMSADVNLGLVLKGLGWVSIPDLHDCLVRVARGSGVGCGWSGD